MLFATGIHPGHILNDIQNNHKDVVVLAYLDDVFILGLQEDALKAFYGLQSLSASVGLHAGS